MFDAMTRSLKVRAMVDNPTGKLKLEMYVNASLTYDLGEKLAVPQEAVMTPDENLRFHHGWAGSFQGPMMSSWEQKRKVGMRCFPA